MKKILLACAIGCVLIFSGCKGSAIEKAQNYISNGEYELAIKVLEKYSDDEAAAPILHQAQLENAKIEAQTAIDAEDYKTAVSLLEQYSDDETVAPILHQAQFENAKIEAQTAIDAEDYKTAVSLLEQYSDDETIAPIFHQAQLENAIIEAQTAMDAENYQTAVSLLENFKDEDKVSKIYNDAKIQVYIQQLIGNWQNCGGKTLNDAYVVVNFNGDEGTASLKHSVENYYGYKDNDIIWKSLKVSKNGRLSLSALRKYTDNTSKYVDVTAVFNAEDNTVEFSDDFFGKWKKITDDEAKAALKENPTLIKTFDGTFIQRNPNALSDFGKRASEFPERIFSDYSYENSNLPYIYLYHMNEIDTYPYEGVVLKGGALSDDIYCGMTMAQVVLLQDQGIITEFRKIDNIIREHDYGAEYQCNINGNTENFQLTFTFDETDERVTGIDFFSDSLNDLAYSEYNQWEYENQQQERQQAVQDNPVYSDDDLVFYFGSVREYIGTVAVCEPSMGTNIYLGSLCFIENYQALNNDLFMIQYGNLCPTNDSITYYGTTYPVYQAVGY